MFASGDECVACEFKRPVVSEEANTSKEEMFEIDWNSLTFQLDEDDTEMTKESPIFQLSLFEYMDDDWVKWYHSKSCCDNGVQTIGSSMLPSQGQDTESEAIAALNQQISDLKKQLAAVTQFITKDLHELLQSNNQTVLDKVFATTRLLLATSKNQMREQPDVSMSKSTQAEGARPSSPAVQNLECPLNACHKNEDECDTTSPVPEVCSNTASDHDSSFSACPKRECKTQCVDRRFDDSDTCIDTTTASSSNAVHETCFNSPIACPSTALHSIQVQVLTHACLPLQCTRYAFFDVLDCPVFGACSRHLLILAIIVLNTARRVLDQTAKDSLNSEFSEFSSLFPSEQEQVRNAFQSEAGRVAWLLLCGQFRTIFGTAFNTFCTEQLVHEKSEMNVVSRVLSCFPLSLIETNLMSEFPDCT